MAISFAEQPIKANTHHPFTREMATEMGISGRQLLGPRFRTVMRGVYVDHRIPDSLPVRTRAALLVAPRGATVSHLTAACLWTANAERSGYIHLSYQADRQCMRDEIKVHRFTYPMERAGRHGVHVTSPGMTLMHLAVTLDLVQLTAFGDMLVKRRVITADQLRSYANAWTHHGVRAGRRAAAYVRSGVDSVPESNLRMLMVLAGLPEPDVNPWVRDRRGERKYRLDLAYPEILLAVEYDGRWHEEPEQQAADEERRAWLRRAGWTIIVVKADDLYRGADATLDTISGALTERGVVIGPRQHEYQRYFGTVLTNDDDPFWGPSPTKA